MIDTILAFLAETRLAHALPVGRVLEVGSQYINGSPRVIFEHLGSEYVGVDQESGPCVDIVADAEQLTSLFPAEYFDTILCCETLEHAVHPWRVVEGMKTLLRPGGLLWISTPTFGFPLHRYPYDCYRFGEDAYRLWLFADMELIRLGEVRDEIGHPCLVAVGRKKP